jgi:hypothetical protein
VEGRDDGVRVEPGRVGDLPVGVRCGQTIAIGVERALERHGQLDGSVRRGVAEDGEAAGGGLGVHDERAVGDEPLVGGGELGAGHLADRGVRTLDVVEPADRRPARAGEQAAGDHLDRQFRVARGDLQQRGGEAVRPAAVGIEDVDELHA